MFAMFGTQQEQRQNSLRPCEWRQFESFVRWCTRLDGHQTFAIFVQILKTIFFLELKRQQRSGAAPYLCVYTQTEINVSGSQVSSLQFGVYQDSGQSIWR